MRKPRGDTVIGLLVAALTLVGTLTLLVQLSISFSIQGITQDLHAQQINSSSIALQAETKAEVVIDSQIGTVLAVECQIASALKIEGIATVQDCAA